MTLRNTNTQRNIVNDHHDQHNEIYDRIVALEDAPAPSGADSIDALSDGYSDDDGNLYLGLEPSALSAGSAFSNTSVGLYAGQDLTTGDANTFLGNGAGMAVTTASDNTAVGLGALQDATIGSENTAVGRQALSNLIDGEGNVGVGTYAAQPVEDGYLNTALGSRANSASPASISYTVAVGCYSQTDADEAIAIGDGAYAENVNSIAIGYGANASADGAIAIGRDSADNPAVSSTQDHCQVGTSLTTLGVGNPGGGAGKWMLGQAKAAAVALDTAHYIEVKIDGTVYKLAVVT